MSDDDADDDDNDKKKTELKMTIHFHICNLELHNSDFQSSYTGISYTMKL